MIHSHSTILVVGAAGKFAGLVVPELAKRGAKIRGLITHENQRDVVRRNGASEIVVGDLTDRVSINAALKGIDSVFYIAPAFLPHEAEIGVAMVDAVKKADVRRIVFSSVIHPSLSQLSNHSAKAPVEEAIVSSGLEYSCLQPALFFQNFASAWPKVIEGGVIAEPWAIETRFSRVDYRDVAEVAAIALTEDRLLYGTFELCSQDILDRNDVAKLMGEVLGREIKAAKINLPLSGDTSQSADDPQAAMRHMMEWYDTHGLLGNSLPLHAILGREPRRLKTYFEELHHGK